MKYEQITVIVDDSGKQISDARAKVIDNLTYVITSTANAGGDKGMKRNLTKDQILELANVVSIFFASKSAIMMEAEIEANETTTVSANEITIDEMDAAHSKKEGE